MDSSGSSSSSGLVGNTISTNPRQIAPAIRWCFTLNNYTIEDCSSIVLTIKDKCKKAIVGYEKGESGTPHLQGYIEFKTKRRPIGVFNIKGIHFEKAKGNAEDNERYCSKDDNLLIKFGFPRPIKIIENLYEWQKKIENIVLGDVDDRKIYWFWESKGNIGKSAFVKYMIVKHKVLFCSGGKYTDIMNLVFNQDMDNCNCVIFDIPRANRGAISYASLESIKNGMVCNTKYETGVKIFNSPHIVVFANFPPEDEDQLSNDRWSILEL